MLRRPKHSTIEAVAPKEEEEKNLNLEKCIFSAVPRPPFEVFPEILHISLTVHTL
jgi:hypothetical protein